MSSSPDRPPAAGSPRRAAQLADLVRAAPGAVRVQPLYLAGQRLWLKRAETRLPLRQRLQKGDPGRALRAEIEGLRFMARHGLPSPEILSSGPEMLVTGDAGAPLYLLFEPDAGAQAHERELALASAMRGLAALHAAGGRHGRPKLRDICWDGKQARLIDFERFRAPARPRDMALDWLILLHSLLEIERDATPLFVQTAKVWLDRAPAPAIRAARRQLRLLRLLGPALRPLARLRPHNKEIMALLALPSALGAVLP